MEKVKSKDLCSSCFKAKQLSENSTEITDGVHKWRVPAKPIRGNSLRERIRGAWLVLRNKADFVRWF